MHTLKCNNIMDSVYIYYLCSNTVYSPINFVVINKESETVRGLNTQLCCTLCIPCILFLFEFSSPPCKENNEDGSTNTHTRE